MKRSVLLRSLWNFRGSCLALSDRYLRDHRLLVCLTLATAAHQCQSQRLGCSVRGRSVAPQATHCCNFQTQVLQLGAGSPSPFFVVGLRAYLFILTARIARIWCCGGVNRLLCMKSRKRTLQNLSGVYCLSVGAVVMWVKEEELLMKTEELFF